MAVSKLFFMTLGYLVGSLLAIFGGSVRDVILCKFGAWVFALPLRLFWFSKVRRSTWQTRSRLIAHAILLLRRPEMSQFVRAVGRLLYHDAPSLDGPPGNEIWEVMAESMAVGAYVTCAIVSAFYREVAIALFNASVAMAWVTACTSLWVVLQMTMMPAEDVATFWSAVPPWIYQNVIKAGLRYLRSGFIRLGIGFLRLRKFILDSRNPLGTFSSKMYHIFAKDTGKYNGQPAFKYKALEGPRYIRLLKLSRQVPFDDMTCELIHVSIDAAPEFDSISYTWGESKKSRGAVVDGQWMSMAHNVHAMLEDLVPAFGSRVIWVDAICINQDDLDEKSRQVALMGQLYKQASRTVVWLGNAEDSDDAFTFLLHLQSNSLNYTANDRDLIDTLGRGTADSRWGALIRLIEHPYWQRAWIIQEIVVGKEVHILYSKTWMKWDYFAGIINAFQDFEKGPLLHMTDFGRLGRMMPIKGMARINAISGLRGRIAAADIPSLAELLIMCKFADATDFRDKVYSVYGMARLPIGYLRPDYRLSVSELYIKTTLSLLQDKDPTFILHHTGVGFERTLSLPSWVPDWSHMGTDSYGTLRGPDPSTSTRYNACSQYNSVRIQDATTLSSGQPAIMVEVLPIGVIVETTKEPSLNVLNLKSLDQSTVASTMMLPLLEWFREVDAIAARRVADPYPATGQQLIEAIWRTLIVGRVDTPTHRIEDFGEFYESTKAFLDLMLRFTKLSEAEQASIDGSVVGHIEELIPRNARFMREFGHAGGPRRFAATGNGLLALVPPKAMANDVVVIMKGCTTPFLIRLLENDKLRFQLVGEAYVHGIMHGEAVQNAEFNPLILV